MRRFLSLLLLGFLFSPASAQQVENDFMEMFVQADSHLEQERRRQEEEFGNARMPNLLRMPVQESLERVRSIDTKLDLQTLVKRVGSEGPSGVVVMQVPRAGELITETEVVLFVSKELESSKRRSVTQAPGARKRVVEAASGLAGWVGFLLFQGVLISIWFLAAGKIEGMINDERRGYVGIISLSTPKDLPERAKTTTQK